MICFVIDNTQDIIDRHQLMNFCKFLLALQKVYPGLFHVPTRGGRMISRDQAWLQCAFIPSVVGVNKEIWFGFQATFDADESNEIRFVAMPSSKASPDFRSKTKLAEFSPIWYFHPLFCSGILWANMN